MAASLLDESPLTLAEAAKALPPLRGGKRVHLATLYRWVSRGVAGVRLESLRLGRTVVTSREALQRFAERLGARVEPATPASPVAAGRAHRVDALLDRHGL